MARFNQPSAGSNTTVNYEGEKAYKLSPELELYSLVVTSSLDSKFYESSDDRLIRLRGLLHKCDHEFIAKLAVYTRNHMYLRSIPLVLTVELASIHQGDDLVRRAVNGVVKRADEITELLAYYQIANKRNDTKKLGKLSKQIQKGLADVFNNFDEYQLAKYNRDGSVKLRDALFLAHPKANDKEQQLIFDKLVENKLETPYTWEVEISEVGQGEYETEVDKQKAVRDKWGELIDSKKLGYMATMRNLRNMLQAEVLDSKIERVCSFLSNEEAVKRSRQLPFRFLSAYREITGEVNWHIRDIEQALEQAIKHSVENIAGFNNDTKVLIACDMSGSMQHQISKRSTVMMYDVGLILGMILQYKCAKVMTGIFGENWKKIDMPKDDILRNSLQFSNMVGLVGHSTNAWKVIDWAIQNKVEFDKMMFFTDCQWWDSGYYGGESSAQNRWGAYKKLFPSAKAYYFDLAGYGTTTLNTKSGDVKFIAGWSEKIFDVLDAIENGSSALKEIEKVAL